MARALIVEALLAAEVVLQLWQGHTSVSGEVWRISSRRGDRIPTITEHFRVGMGASKPYSLAASLGFKSGHSSLRML
jgi:hypothetical protein